MFEAFVIWLLCGIAGGAMLSRYNKAGIGCLLGGLLGPIGLIIAWTMRDSAKIDESRPTLITASQGAQREVTREEAEAEVRRIRERERDERECPHCAERILARAKVCRYCGRDVAPLS